MPRRWLTGSWHVAEGESDVSVIVHNYRWADPHNFGCRLEARDRERCTLHLDTRLRALQLKNAASIDLDQSSKRNKRPHVFPALTKTRLQV